MTSDKPRIAIIGAGPVGLCLSRILQENAIPITLFESESSADMRAQGGSLDLHPPSGQAALKKAGLFEAFEKHARYDGQMLRVGDRFGKLYIDSNEDTGRPEIDRSKLREILLDSVDPANIRWGAAVERVDPNAGAVHLKSGEAVSGFDLIIGTDGLATYDLWIEDVDARHPHLGELVGRGSLFLFGEDSNTAMFAQRQGDGSIHIYAMASFPESEVPRRVTFFDDPAKARADVLAMYKRAGGWAQKYLELVEKCDDLITFRGMFQLPVGLRWSSRRGVTLAGDAAHVMTPFTGEGVNLGMTDAMHLADAIIKHGKDTFAAVKEYEDWMLPHAREKTQATWDVMIRAMDPGFLDMYTAKFNQDKGEDGYAKMGARIHKA